MEKVASHINEMQKIYEEYGSVFDQLAAEQIGPHRQVGTPENSQNNTDPCLTISQLTVSLK